MASGVKDQTGSDTEESHTDGYSRFGVETAVFLDGYEDEVTPPIPENVSPKRPRSPSPMNSEELEDVQTILFTPLPSSSSAIETKKSEQSSSSSAGPTVSCASAIAASKAKTYAPPTYATNVEARNLIALWSDENMIFEGEFLANVNERLQERCTVVGHWVDTDRNWLWALVKTEAQARQFVKNTNGIKAMRGAVTLRSNMSKLSDWPPGTFPFEKVHVQPVGKGKGK